MESDRDARIRERAYAIWEREGQPHGRHVEHWMQAKAEIAAEEQAGETASQQPPAQPGSSQPQRATPAQEPAIRSEPVRVSRERSRDPGESQVTETGTSGLEPAEAGQRGRRRGRRGGEQQES